MNGGGRPAAPVPWLIKPNGERIDPDKLADLLGVVLTDLTEEQAEEKARKKTNARRRGARGSFADEPTEQVDLTAWHMDAVAMALKHDTSDRSADIMRVVGVCVRSRLTLPKTRWVVRSREDLAEKLDELTHDDVERCFNKATAALDDEKDDDDMSSDGQEQDTPDDIAPSWGRIDLSGVLSGDRKPVVATLLVRTDGIGLMYPGLVHDFHGESDTGKSMVLQALAAWLINQGEDVLYIDHESDAKSVVERLIMLGADPLMIAKHFDYRQPEMSPGKAEDEQAAWDGLLANRYALAVIDGVTDALGIFGYSIGSNDDAAAWSRTRPPRASPRGPGPPSD